MSSQPERRAHGTTHRGAIKRCKYSISTQKTKPTTYQHSAIKLQLSVLSTRCSCSVQFYYGLYLCSVCLRNLELTESMTGKFYHSNTTPVTLSYRQWQQLHTTDDENFLLCICNTVGYGHCLICMDKRGNHVYSPGESRLAVVKIFCLPRAEETFATAHGWQPQSEIANVV